MRRQRGIQAALALTLVATGWIALQPEDEAIPAAVLDRPSPRAAQPPPRAVAALVSARPALTWPEPSEQALVAWGPPPLPPAPPPLEPAAVPPPAMAAAPRAPAFPYALIGRFTDEHGPQLLLVGPDKTVSVRVADVLDGQWRIDAVQPDGVSMTWLPGSVRQTLTYRPS